MIEKNYNKLDQALSKDDLFIHMNERKENKEEYIKDILNNNRHYIRTNEALDAFLNYKITYEK